MATLVYGSGFEHGHALTVGVGGGLCVANPTAGTGANVVEAAAARTGGFGLRTQRDGTSWITLGIYDVPGQIIVGSFYWKAPGIAGGRRSAAIGRIR